MKEFIKKNFAIFLAFLLPILLIAIVALSSYLPSLFLSTSYNFIYTACDTGSNNYPYYCNAYLQKRYTIIDGKLVINHVDLLDLSKELGLDKMRLNDFNEKYNARIFLHDTKKNESREITQEEAKLLTLNNLLTSPDGITVSSNYNRGGDFMMFPFGGNYSSYGYYLSKGKSKSKLNLINTTDQYYYQNNFQFLGWVLPGRN